MQFFDFDHIVVYFFLIATLFLGLWVGRKTKTIQDYAIASRDYGLGVLAITILATYLGAGALLGDSAATYRDGIIVALIAIFASLIPWLLMAFALAPRIVKFRKCITLGNLVSNLYGDRVSMVVAILGTLHAICIMGMQIFALGVMGEVLLGFNPTQGRIVGGLVFVFYSALGGMRAVAITDVLQFIVLTTVVPIIAGFAIERAGGITDLWHQIPADKWVVLQHPRFYYYLTICLIWGIFPGFHLSPPNIQRILMANDEKSIKRGYLIGAGVQSVFTTIVILTGMAAIVVYPNIEPKNVFPHIVQQAIPVGLQGIAIAGVLAVIMSTADSFLHASGILITHDVLRPFFKARNTSFNELNVVKYVTFCVGGLSILISLYATDIYQLGVLAAMIYGPIVVIPFIAGLMGLKVDEETFFIAGGTAVMTFILGKLILTGKFAHLVSPISIVANFISFFAAHFFKNGKLTYKKSGTEAISKPRKERNNHSNMLFSNVKNAFLSPLKLYHFSKERVAQYGTNHILFTAFCYIHYIVPYFLWKDSLGVSKELIMGLRTVAVLLCLAVFFQKYWPEEVYKKYFPAFWFFTLTYALPFTTTIMLLATNGAKEWLISIMTVILCLVFMLDWVSFLALGALGVGSGMVVYFTFIGDISSVDFDAHSQALLFYQLTFGTILGTLISWKRSRETRHNIGRAHVLADTLSVEVKNTASDMQSYAQQIGQTFARQKLSKIVNEEGKPGYFIKQSFYDNLCKMGPEVIEMSKKTLHTIEMLQDAIQHNIITSDLKICSVQDCIKKALLEFNFSASQKENLKVDLSQDFKVKVSPEHFKHIIFNLLRFSYRHSNSTPVAIWLSDDSTIHFKIDDQGVDPDLLVKMFDLFHTASHEDIGVGIAYSKMIVEAFDGIIQCRSQQDENSFTEFVISLPQVAIEKNWD